MHDILLPIVLNAIKYKINVAKLPSTIECIYIGEVLLPQIFPVKYTFTFPKYTQA